MIGFLISTTSESQPPGWLSLVLMGHVFANWARTLFAIICQTYHWCQAPLIGFREWVVIIYGSDDITEIEGVS